MILVRVDIKNKFNVHQKKHTLLLLPRLQLLDRWKKRNANLAFSPCSDDVAAVLVCFGCTIRDGLFLMD